MKRVLVALAGVVLLVLIAVEAYVRFVGEPSSGSTATPRRVPTSAPSAAPPVSATATPAAETPRPAVVADAKPASVPKPPALRKPVLVGPPSVSALVAQAERSAAAKEYERAAELYDQALAIEPKNAKAAAGRLAMAAELAARHTFVTGETLVVASGETKVEGKKGASPIMPPGFDGGGGAARVAPKVAADIEFEVVPARVKPGDPYAVKVYLRNRGKKSIKIREMRIASSSNGARSEATVTPKMAEVPPELMALLTEVPSIWKAGVSGWSMEVAVRSNHGDVYKNNVTWK
jgi:hypothetical protein